MSNLFGPFGNMLFGTSYRNRTAKEVMDMAKNTIGGIQFDPSNISGAKLAEIGRWTLTGKKIVEEQMRVQEGDYTHMGWLDMRINEICERGRL